MPSNDSQGTEPATTRSPTGFDQNSRSTQEHPHLHPPVPRSGRGAQRRRRYPDV